MSDIAARLLDPRAALSKRAGILAVVGLAAVIVTLAVNGTIGSLFAGAAAKAGPPPGIVVVGSSWVTGEPSLAASPAFDAIEARAVSLAQLRWTARTQLLAAIVAAKRAAAARARADALKKYEELRARELAAYRAKLRAIARLRAQELAKERAAQEKYKRELAAYLRARTVTPGQECRDPVVRRYYSCKNGLLPVSPKKGH